MNPYLIRQLAALLARRPAGPAGPSGAAPPSRQPFAATATGSWRHGMPDLPSAPGRCPDLGQRDRLANARRI